MPSVKETLIRWIDDQRVFPSGKEQRILARAAKAGDKEAQEKLWMVCERICAKKVKERVPEVDLRQDALHWIYLEIFLPAIANYNPRQHMKFVSYVAMGVDLKFYRWRAEQNLIRIPENTLLKAMRKGAKNPRLTAALKAMFISSTDEILHREDNDEPLTARQDQASPVPPSQTSREEKFPTETTALREILAETIRKGIETLEPREREVVILTFGLNGNKRITNLSAAKLLGVRRTTVVNTKREALKKLGQYILKNFPQVRQLSL